ncbi:MAG: hypothetical protein H0V10_01245 [Geodermatophilaceae bacterium]|nr:hypothetical protein [Geodermatophilaceae bacterium]
MDFEIQGDKGRALSRFVLDGRRLYILNSASRRPERHPATPDGDLHTHALSTAEWPPC